MEEGGVNERQEGGKDEREWKDEVMEGERAQEG